MKGTNSSDFPLNGQIILGYLDKFERILGPIYMKGTNSSDFPQKMDKLSSEMDKFERFLGPIYMKGTNSSDFSLNGQTILGKKVDKFKSCGNLGGQIKIACWNTPLCYWRCILHRLGWDVSFVVVFRLMDASRGREYPAVGTRRFS